MREVPIVTVPLFRELNSSLVELLGSLTQEEWNTPTLFPSWKVKDVAAHLLDTSIRRLSQQRDGYQSTAEVELPSYRALVEFVTKMADRWADALGGVSPRILVEMISTYQDQLSDMMEAADPFDTAHFSVVWAGEETSENWFDFAREYTERWLHQMHVADALERPSKLLEPRLYKPLLDTFMQALPHHYRLFDPEKGTQYRFVVDGEAGGEWTIELDGTRWAFTTENRLEQTDSVITLPEKIAWKILSKGIPRAEALSALSWEGEESVARHLLSMSCVMV